MNRQCNGQMKKDEETHHGTQHRKLKIEKYEPSKMGASSIPVPLVVPVVLILKRHSHHLIQNSRKQINIYLFTKAWKQRRSEHLVTHKS